MSGLHAVPAEDDPPPPAEPPWWPEGPSAAGPCSPGRGRRHYVRADRTAGRITWECVHCGMRYRFGDGVVA